MKNFFVLSFVALVAFSFTTAIASFSVDTNNSKVVWTASKVTGTHTGTVKVKSGDLKLEGGKLVGGSFVIDMTTIDCTDLEGEWKDKLVGHLKSPVFHVRKRAFLFSLILA